MCIDASQWIWRSEIRDYSFTWSVSDYNIGLGEKCITELTVKKKKKKKKREEERGKKKKKGGSISSL